MNAINIVRVTLSRQTREEIAERRVVATAPDDPRYFDALAEHLYERAVRDGVIPSAVPAAEGDRERAG